LEQPVATCGIAFSSGLPAADDRWHQQADSAWAAAAISAGTSRWLSAGNKGYRYALALQHR
jgi:hypothetical protein